MYELSVTRLIDAPPAKVWDTLVNRTNEWWCPKPWRAEVNWGERKAGDSVNLEVDLMARYAARLTERP